MIDVDKRDWFTVLEAADYLQVCTATVYSYLRRKILTSAQPAGVNVRGSIHRIPKAQVIALNKARAQETATEATQ